MPVEFLVMRSTISLRLSIAFAKRFAAWDFLAADADDFRRRLWIHPTQIVDGVKTPELAGVRRTK